MKLAFTESAWQDYLWFQEHNRPLLKRINALIKDTQRNPFGGLGKPEPLKSDLSGYWSRRINAEHRLVYSVSETELTIISCRYHYSRNGILELSQAGAPDNDLKRTALPRRLSLTLAAYRSEESRS